MMNIEFWLRQKLLLSSYEMEDLPVTFFTLETSSRHCHRLDFSLLLTAHL